MAAPERVTIAIADGIADVRLARADKLNACDSPMIEALAAAIDRLAGERAVRCVLLSGEGRAFSVGIDLASFGGDAGGLELAARTHGDANLFQQVAWGWRTLPQPVIAAVHGFAFGAGFQIMLGADIRIAAPDAELALMEARWGLVPDMGGIALMRGLVRDDVARELSYTGRRIDGAEAARLGIVTRTAADPHAEAMATARAIAAMSPAAIRAAKRLHGLAADADAATILRAEAAEQQALLASAGHREALAAARERRAPRFDDDAGDATGA